MINVLLDRLPREWRGIPINTNFRTGIQISQALNDNDLTDRERIAVASDLLYGDNTIIGQDDALEGITCFMTGWNNDKPSNEIKKKIKTMDYDIDQWRIYAAFLRQYQIDLNEIEYMHWWTFMGLFTNLEECTLTRVMDIRSKKIDARMSAEEKKRLGEVKKMYALEQEEPEEPEDNEEEKQRKNAEIEAFNRLRGAHG